MPKHSLHSRFLGACATVALVGSVTALRPAPQSGPGRLVIVGGGLSANNESVYRAILDGRSGTGPLCVFPTAAAEPESAMAGPVAIFDKFGGPGTARGVFVADGQPETARDPAVAAQIRACSGFFFVGGVQSRVVRAFRPEGKTSPAYEALLERWRTGAVVSGSSAGAAIMSDPMIAGGTSAGAIAHGVRSTTLALADSDDAAGAVTIAPGLGFFSAALADQHFLARGRFGRLLVAMLELEQFDLAFGIDENTALVVDGNTVSAAGASGILVLDERSARRTGPTVTGVGVHLISAGDRYDIATRTVAMRPEKTVLARTSSGAPVVPPKDVFARWELLHFLDRFARSPQTDVTIPLDGAQLTIRKGPAFRAVAGSGDGVQKTPAGLAMSGLSFDLRR